MQKVTEPSTRPPAPIPVGGGTADERRARRDRVLFMRWHAGDSRAREELIARFMPLARSVARRYMRSGDSLDDLVQVASLALVKAIDRYDVTRGYAFSSYAVPTIAGELRRYFRDRTWAVRPPRELQELVIRIDRAADRLSQQFDRAPSVRELAEAVGSTDELVLEAMQARSARGSLSLQATINREDEHASLQDTLGLSDDGFGNAESRVLLDQLLAVLPQRSREVLRLRFEHDLTQAEIGAQLGVSQMQVSRIVRAALIRLRMVAEQHDQMTDRRIHAAVS
jgi:RNA polymerase sigma-B factor